MFLFGFGTVSIKLCKNPTYSLQFASIKKFHFAWGGLCMHCKESVDYTFII